VGTRIDADEDSVMRVSATSPPQAVASSINHSIFEDQMLPTIRAIGAGAVAQTCKGIAIARGQVAVRGHDLLVSIGFDNVTADDGSEISAQTFRLVLR
jgi:stage V sporulation protein SpoVS